MNPFTFFLNMLASMAMSNYTINTTTPQISYPPLSFTPKAHSYGVLYYKYVDDDF